MTRYEPDLEKCVIGALCIDPTAMEQIATFLKPDDFELKACSVLYEAMLNLFIHNEPIDVALLPQYLVDLMENPTKYIADCMTEAPTRHNVVLHAHVVHDAANERRLRDAVYEAFDECEKDVLATNIIQKCQDYLEDRISRTATMFDIVNEACDNIAKDNELRIDTGFPRLDGILKGMYGGNLIIIGARPGVGKSCLGIDLAETAARKGNKAIYFSLEMLRDELAERMICKKGHIPLDHIIDKTMTEDEIARYSMACADLSMLPIIINDSPDVTVQQIRAQARIVPDAKIIFVDHIGLLKASGKYQNRNLELGAISRELKNLATELRIPIVVLAQLNRAKDETQEPQLSDLRDSGELEQNASKVLFLWKLDDETGIRGCKVAKNRRGKTGMVQMNFEGEYQRLVERSEDIDWKSGRRSQGSDYDEF